MNIIRKNIPNCLTCLNILSGCIAIIFAFHAEVKFGVWFGWQWAALAIGAAALADFFDGFSARLLGAYSELGKELDSLSDLVSFGVAPAMLLLNVLQSSAVLPAWLPPVTLVIPICGALRLARFNVDPSQHDGFKGLPIPANAIFWIGWIAYLQRQSSDWMLNQWIILAIILLEAYSMISPMRLFSLKFKNYRWAGNQPRWIIILASVIMLTFWGLPAFFPIICCYIILSKVPFPSAPRNYRQK